MEETDLRAFAPLVHAEDNSKGMWPWMVKYMSQVTFFLAIIGAIVVFWSKVTNHIDLDGHPVALEKIDKLNNEMIVVKLIQEHHASQLNERRVNFELIRVLETKMVILDASVSEIKTDIKALLKRE